MAHLVGGCPHGMLVVAILHANNTRDMLLDKAAGIRTQAILLGLEGSQVAYQTILILAYLLVVTAVWLSIVNPLVFVVLLTFPLAMRNIRLMRSATIDNLGVIGLLDVNTAKLVLIFSLLFSIANFVAPVI